MALEYDVYEFKLTLIRDMLATNPSDPNVLDTHIINRQRSLIMEKSGVNKEINKYLDQLQISKEKGEEEVNRILDKLENLIGMTLSPEERELAIRGELEMLKETFKELDLKGTTVFFWDKETDRPCIGDHMIYGFMKAASEAICRTKEGRGKGVILESASYTSSVINQHVRCEKQFIPFDRDIKRDEQGRPFFFQRSLRAMTAQGPRVSLAKSEVVEAGSKLHFKLKVIKGSPLKREHIQRIFDHGEIVGLGQWRNSGRGMFTYEMM